MAKIQTPEQRAEREALKARVNAEAKENWGDPAWRALAAKEISDLILYGYDHENLLQYLTTVETAEDDDRITVEELDGVHVSWVAPGARIERTTWDDRIFEITPDRIAFGIDELSEKMRSNFFTRQEVIVNGAIQSLDQGINSRLLSLFRDGTSSSTPYYVAAAGVAIADINAAITDVADESLSDNVTIVGRGTMIDQIFNQLQSNGNFAPVAQDEIVRSGFLGTYRGANLVKLKNYKAANTRQSYFRANELYVVGADASTTGLWGSLETDEWESNGVNNKRWNLEGMRKAGMVLTHPERVRRIVDTSRAA